MWGAALEIPRLVFCGSLKSVFFSSKLRIKKQKRSKLLGANIPCCRWWHFGNPCFFPDVDCERQSLAAAPVHPSICPPLFPWFFCLRQRSVTESHSGTSFARRPHAGLRGSDCSDYVVFRLWCTITAKSIIRDKQWCFCKKSFFFFFFSLRAEHNNTTQHHPVSKLSPTMLSLSECLGSVCLVSSPPSSVT